MPRISRDRLERENLSLVYPDLASQWHPDKNGELGPSEVFPGSHMKVWWQCDEGHEWEVQIYRRASRGDGCPYCSGHRVLPGFNDLATIHPLLAAEWHPIKNNGLLVHNFSTGSNQKVWWLGKCGHEWEATVANRSKKIRATGCPVCSNRKAVEQFNDLASTDPNLASQWHPTKNTNFNPFQVTSGSHIKVWWQCGEGHEWEAQVYKRFKYNHGCPVCSGTKIQIGFNDLTSTHKTLVEKEWDFNKNLQSPKEVSKGAELKAWWVCSSNHSWQAAVYSRTGLNPNGCPRCALSIQASRAEIELRNWIRSYQTNISVNDRFTVSGVELDIYLPSKKIAIEYNGLYWHSERSGRGKNYHYDKWLACKEAGVQLIQIWEDDWKRNPELVKKVLAHKLGSSSSNRVYARNLTVEETDRSIAESLLNSNHIQGFASGSYYIALKDESGGPVAVLVLKKEAGGILNIVRYATSKTVVGGFTKLLKYAERTYQPSKFVTFSDNCVSDGGLYEKNGFTATKQLPPDYMYVVKGERKHKFGYRLKKFKNDPNLLWEEGLSERELALLNNIPRIWDAGKTKWEKDCGSFQRLIR